MSDKMGPGKEEGRGPANDAPPEPPVEDDPRPLTGEPAAAMRLRAEPPRVTRLSRKALA
ncbi:conjugal transfer protein TraI, partial [Mesorhizobium sp. M7A.F.Ca.US.003.02.1.1]